MPKDKKNNIKPSSRLHPRNKHKGRYDLKSLVKIYPDLEPHIIANKYGNESIDFFDPVAVKLLNTALLKQQYNINSWEIPEGYLCPPIPGRADYIHHVADLLAEVNNQSIPAGNSIKCLDIGMGANCIYPILGNQEYGWSFVGSDIDPIAITAAQKIIENNDSLKENIEIRLQSNSKDIFFGIIGKNEFFDVTICNPPFHRSEEDARASNARKVSNLKGKKIANPVKNFGGNNSELWCEGGELQFVKNMIRQSKRFAGSCFWFTTLISKQTHVKNAYHELRQVSAMKIKTIPMGQGNKSSRIIAWTFLSLEEQKKWIEKRWHNSEEEE